jgi:hypothetical protein
MKSNQTPHLGYVLHPARRDSEPGYSRVEVWLSDTISGLHFDPRVMRLPVADDSGGISWVTVGHPHYVGDRLRVCAGPIDVIGFGDKRLNVFTFGGELAIKDGEESTLAAMTSEAPILVRIGPHPVTALLMEEAELILALRRGAWDEQPGEFERRLLLVEPLELYHAFLEIVLARMQSVPGEHEGEQQLRYQLRREMESIESQASTAFRRLDEIL